MKIVAVGVVSILVLTACGGSQPAQEAAPAATAVAEAPAPVAPSAPPAVTPADAPALLVGRWVSIEDAKSTVEVTADGKWIDRYEGPDVVNETSAWKVFTTEDAPPEAKDYTLEAGKAYLSVTGSAGPLFYELGVADADTFEMFYLARGNRHAFNRVR